ncbi:MAG: OB-fold nucleic acid binding domain-containing protein, partial [Candidatus Krumholzibacteria bacterium]|nr:OB-fold nucleic acid binding domain-containing protein [Candidatus Krumholzibacteria bacterium]
MNDSRSPSLRTHRCGEISTGLIGQKVSLAGWAARIRHLGGVVFVDLRDRWGEIQIVCEDGTPRDMAGDFKLEAVLHVQGTVRPRPAGMVNPDKLTGAVEVVAERVAILNTCAPLPFQIDQADRVEEELRLRYRYLHLRHPELARNLQIRHRAAQATRRFLSAHDFLEIETPLLIK